MIFTKFFHLNVVVCLEEQMMIGKSKKNLKKILRKFFFFRQYLDDLATEYSKRLIKISNEWKAKNDPNFAVIYQPYTIGCILFYYIFIIFIIIFLYLFFQYFLLYYFYYIFLFFYFFLLLLLYKYFFLI